MSQTMCHTCERRPIVIRCLTESLNLCLTCDNLRHNDPDKAGHVRYQTCDDCTWNAALLLCSECKIVLCQSCYSLHHNCDIYGHRIQVIKRFPQQQQQQQNNNNDDHHQHDNNDNHEPRLGHQRRHGLFEMSCNGDNNCERWMFAMKCESCLVSNAIIYCPDEDQLLCHICDRMIHNLEVVPPHMRSVLCVTCKRVSRNILVESSRFVLPPKTPPRSPSSGPSQQDSHIFLN